MTVLALIKGILIYEEEMPKQLEQTIIENIEKVVRTTIKQVFSEENKKKEIREYPLLWSRKGS
jgi:hypothetical protein